MRGKLMVATALVFLLAGPAFGVDCEEALQQYVQRILPYKAPLTAFLKEMPKGGDLHYHSIGGVYAETFVAQAMDNQPPIYFDPRSRGFAPPGATPRDAIGPEDMRGDVNKFGQVVGSLSYRRTDPHDESGHDHFFTSFGRFAAAVPPHETEATEVFTRAIAQKVRHIELMVFPDPPALECFADEETWEEAERYAGDHPRRWQLAYPEQKERGVAFALAVHELLNAFEESRLSLLAALGMEKDDFTARYILSVNRVLEPTEFEQAFTDLIAAWNHGDDRLAGFTILSPEDSWPSKAYFREQFKIIDRYVRDDANWRDGVRPRFSWHAGELSLDYSTYEAMRDRIGETIWMGHADRIGHGTSIAWEDNPYELLQDMRMRGICVEICPTSSDVILGVRGNDHPFHLYRSAGVPIVLSTDDEGVSRTNITNEYVKAAQDFNLDYKTLKELSRNSLEYSFLPGDSLFEDRCYTKRKPAPPAGSLKAKMQAKLEKDFVEFERNMVDRILKTIIVAP